MLQRNKLFLKWKQYVVYSYEMLISFSYYPDNGNSPP